MKSTGTARYARLRNAWMACGAAAILLFFPCVLRAQQPGRANPATQRPPQFNQNNGTRGFGGQNRAGVGGQGGAPPRGEHLSQWMQQHGNLNQQQQQRALRMEPGFSQLPQSTQQRMMNRLNQLNNMPEQQRQRVLQRGEMLERLQPQQRMQVRSAMGQLGALPEDRRRAVARSFRELRSLPQAQRDQLLNSPEYRQQFTDEERGTLGNLLTVSPMLPPSR